ncbi:MAG: energy-coupling factor ABC transporter permease [Deltaproteobacteria bacterium]|nr:energy-coupling factor ABC transporter permease [Deltaproteobacteria bacterium]
MHMADALLSPAVGTAMWGAAAATIAYSSMKVKKELDDRRIPLMGVLGAFIFAAQMINFTIPATGSSGHLGGGLLLTILLGPHAAFLTIASVLVVQSLFFADGGVLALGCNMFNLGFFPAFIAYPLIYRKIAGAQATQRRMTGGAIVAAVAGLQLGAFGVVLETVASGISSLPFATFVGLMQPIHLAIGIVEGLVTATVVAFVYKARPEIVAGAMASQPVGTAPLRRILFSFLAAALLTGGVVSWFASENPDGLEWAIARVTGAEEVAAGESPLHHGLADLQEKVAFLPDYSFRQGVATDHGATVSAGETGQDKASRLGTSVAGGVGALLSLAIAFCLGFVLKRRHQVA